MKKNIKHIQQNTKSYGKQGEQLLKSSGDSAGLKKTKYIIIPH